MPFHSNCLPVRDNATSTFLRVSSQATKRATYTNHSFSGISSLDLFLNTGSSSPSKNNTSNKMRSIKNTVASRKLRVVGCRELNKALRKKGHIEWRGTNNAAGMC